MAHEEMISISEAKDVAAVAHSKIHSLIRWKVNINFNIEFSVLLIVFQKKKLNRFRNIFKI